MGNLSVDVHSIYFGARAIATLFEQNIVFPTNVFHYEGVDELEKIGFSLRYARNTVSVDAIPEEVDSAAVPDMLGSMAGRILDNTGSVKLTRDIIFEKALYQASCKAAIKAGREYPEGHVKWIVDRLMAIPDITVCPHGRPVMIEISKYELEKQFGRV